MIRSCIAALGSLLVGSAAAQAITINVTFDPAAGFTPAEQDVIHQARAYWESFIISPEAFNATVQRAPLSGGLLGQASNYLTTPGGAPAGGTITFDTGTLFFVDPNPADNSEFIQNVSPPTYFSAPPGSPAHGSFDLLTVAIHEFGHVLGFTSFFPQFGTNIFPSADSPQQVYVFQNTPALGDPVIFYLAGQPLNNLPFGGVYMPPMDENEEEAGSATGIPSHLDDRFRPNGVSAGLYTLDVMNEALSMSERRLIFIPDLDILAGAYGYSVIPEPGTLTLLIAGLGVLAARGVGRRNS